MTTLENVALALPPQDLDQLRERLETTAHDYGLTLHPDRHAYDLSMGERQRIEIVRCLLQNPSLLILDEPTSVLTPQETDTLFTTLRTLAAEGRSILYISHKLEEVRSLVIGQPFCAAASGLMTAILRRRPPSHLPRK